MIVWRRERRHLKFMALSIGRIGSESTQAPSLSIGDRRLSRFRSSATPPTCVRVRDRPTLSNARSRIKTPRGQSGRKRARQAGFAYAPARLFRAHSARAAPRAIPFNRLKPFDRDGFADLVVPRPRPAAHLAPLHHIITRLRKSCENNLGIPRWPPQSQQVDAKPR